MRFTCIGLVEQDVLAARGEGDCNAKLGITILGEAVNVEDEIVVINSIVLPNKTLNILVATPGRLKDHIEHTTGFATRLMGVKVLVLVLVLVLDEADLLLDMGFRKDIEKIIAAVPKERQTLLFSATVPRYSKSPASTLLILAYH